MVGGGGKAVAILGLSDFTGFGAWDFGGSGSGALLWGGMVQGLGFRGFGSKGLSSWGGCRECEG